MCGDDRRDVGGDQRRRRLRLAGDVVVLDHVQRVGEGVRELPHLGLAERELVEELLLDVTRAALRQLVQLAERSIAQIAQRALGGQRVATRAVSNCLSWVGEIDATCGPRS